MTDPDLRGPAEDAGGMTTPAGLARRRVIVVLAGVLIAGLALAMIAVGFRSDPTAVDSPLLGRPAPLFVLATLDGRQVDLAALRGRPVLVNFWASWCGPCRDEAPLLARADTEYGPAGLAVIGIVFQDTPENARAFMARYGQTFPGLIDPGGRTALDYGVFGIPETFFVGRDGGVVSRQVGPIDWPSLERQVQEIIR